ncbi:transposase domain-containing protein [Streptococcus pluranimalium]|uniref:transposase domain-containing protein n=1 Tax=Streptococcus pluranimalium TaxID=82348 RepID=UPI0039FD63BD
MKSQDKIIESLRNELTLLREQVAYLTQKRYGKSSEKLTNPSGQLSLFEEDQLPEEDIDLPR